MDAVEFERVEYSADVDQGPRIRDDLRQWLRSSAVPSGVVDGMVLAASEAIDNVVVHAYDDVHRRDGAARIDLTVMLDDGEVLVTVADGGRWRAPESVDLEHDVVGRPALHGRGITLMTSQVDEVAIRHGDRGTTVLLRSRWASPM
ncbi:ATP-binding protein [Actinomycetospora soli]|uniref:ATP-binding protein n=1 Tax=Actinomycetospora soli TaxID=2893887 RepID=UPI001E5B0CC1|nr:ATP-binding protein [Actinomycetospora soli]MCD2186969.1 ATP-binding protein [Actinomycetospora soli]